MKLSPRAANLRPSPTLAITAKAGELRAQGIDVLSLSAGEPDFDTPSHIKDAAKKALDDGFTKYTPAGGTPQLKKAVCDATARDYDLEYEPANILISCGAKHSIYNALQVLVADGDEVIIPAPFWVSYPAMVELAEGIPVIVETTAKNGFCPTARDIKSALTPKTKAIILNSPNNPTGGGYTRKQLTEIAEALRGTDVWVISDDIYGKITYDDFEFVGIATLGNEIRERTLIINGVSKAYSMTGWRIGWTIGDAKVIKAMGALQSQVTSNPTSFAQAGAIAALTGPQGDVTKMVTEFAKRREYILKRLSDIDGVSCYAPNGAFYVFPDVSEYCGTSFEAAVIPNSEALCAYLLEEAKVATVPGSAFGAEGFLRMSYATDMDTITKALDRIEEALAKLKK